MDINAIITLIMTIITMLMQLFGPKPTPVPTPPPFADAMTHVICGDSQWSETPSFGDVYVQGTMVKDCTVKLDAINLSSDEAIDRMTSSVLGAIEQNPANTPSDEAYELSSTMKRDFNSSQVLQVQGQQVPVTGKVSLVSDHARSLTAQYQTESLPSKGDASYLKTLQTATQVLQGKTDPTKFLVRVTTTTQVLRPWFAPASQFKPAVLQQLKGRVDQHASDTITNLVNGLQ